MLLVIDVGNTNTVLGMFKGETLLADWRIETRPGRTADEHALFLRQLIGHRNLSPELVDGCVLACVVPPSERAVLAAMRATFGCEPLLIDSTVDTGMPILVDHPAEVGADRIVNAVAAYERERGGCLVVDFGTATTVDVVSPRGEYLGGAICPGLVISADALYQRAAKLPRVQLVPPARAVGKNTVESIQSGLVNGYIALVDGLVTRIQEELDYETRVYATGGQALLVAEYCPHIDVVDARLTLDGLRLIHERTRG